MKMRPRADRTYLATMRMPLVRLLVLRRLAAAGVFFSAMLAGACASTGGGGDDQRFEAIHSTAFPAADAKILGVLTSGTGRLLVLGRETDSLTVNYAVSAGSRDALFRNLVETIDKGDSMYVTIRPVAMSQVDLQVEAPEHLALQLHDEGRDARVHNIENRVDVVLHGRGSLDMDDIEGPLTIRDGVGPLRIHDVRGPVVIQDEGGGIVIDDVKNSVRITARSGDVTVTNVGADVRVEAGSGSLTIRNVGGKLSYRKTGTGKVMIEGIAAGVEKL